VVASATMPADRNGPSEPHGSAILTVPNLLSFARVAAVPFVAWALARRGTEALGLLAFAALASTDWIDGYVARRTGRVSELGKILDPLADRVVVITVVVVLVLRDALPPWAVALIVARDAVLLVFGGAFLVARGIRIDVRAIGKAGTAALMLGVPLIAWGSFGLWLGSAATVLGWAAFAVGVVLAYSAAALYAIDLRRALERYGRR
jgi:cardiolipin synthase